MTEKTGRVGRRAMVGLAAWTAAALSLGARAQSATTAPKVLGVFSLLGSTIDVTANNTGRNDTRIQQSANSSFEVPKIGLDDIVLREVSAWAATRKPEPRLNLNRAHVNISVSEQRALSAGARKAELPAWIMDVLTRQKLTHLLIVTRARAEVALRTDDGYAVGSGDALGLGFYMDGHDTSRNETTGSLAKGKLGAYVLLDLVLLDAQTGDLVATHELRDQTLVAPEGDQGQTDPWTFIGPERKVEILRQMLTVNLQRVLPLMLNKALA